MVAASRDHVAPGGPSDAVGREGSAEPGMEPASRGRLRDDAPRTVASSGEHRSGALVGRARRRRAAGGGDERGRDAEADHQGAHARAYVFFFFFFFTHPPAPLSPHHPVAPLGGHADRITRARRSRSPACPGRALVLPAQGGPVDIAAVRSGPLGQEPEHVLGEGLRCQHVRDVLLTVDDGDAGVRQAAGHGVDVAPEVRRAVAAGDQERRARRSPGTGRLRERRP